ncbi:uncharacterized protein LOC132186051 [Corylus avellana]|uniref:uncharacterized protein LOC132186051 n=1 Tax=Corylus avellana TaxID=13451 RepID=UPI00286BE5F7|nr:uncharacterized protein LOC132186051 [Corylus avellana]
MWSKTGFMRIKLDMSNAYDKVEWVFLEAVMKKMEFPDKWIRLIMGCALNSLLTQAENKEVITGVPSSKNGPRLSHLFFTDDSLLFCKANLVEWRRITKILEKYEAASGQCLNKNKRSIFFSWNASLERRNEIIQLSGLQATHSFDKYLGLPALVGKSRYQSFKTIKDKLPVVLCREINGMMQQFWWGHEENTSEIHWMIWERMGIAKSNGGLGFRDLVIFNKALLAKQVWRLLTKPESLATRVLKAKYFQISYVLEAIVGLRPSYAWRSLMASQELLKNGLLWRVGDGQDIKIWGARWLPTPTSFSMQSPNNEFDVEIGEFKINWDAALDNCRDKTGLGMIARDWLGNFVAARSIPMDCKLEPASAEAQAALHATFFAKELGLPDITFEGDAQQIITSINSKQPCTSSYGHLVDGAILGLGVLGNSRFLHVKREANSAALGLAKLALNLVTEITWVDSLPPEISGIVRKEASLVVL